MEMRIGLSSIKIILRIFSAGIGDLERITVNKMAFNKAAKVAKGLLKYESPIPKPFVRPIDEQMQEYLGLGAYHCAEY